MLSVSFADFFEQDRREKEHAYLKESRKHYQLLWDRGNWDPHYSRYQTQLYAEQRYIHAFKTLKIVRVHFEVFLDYLRWNYEYTTLWWARGHFGYYRPFWYYGGRSSVFYDRHRGLDFRERMAFRQHGVEKKVLDEQAQHRRDWRERKRFAKDASRHKGYRGYNARRFGKDQVHSKNRRHAKRMIHAERYDEVTQGVQDALRTYWD